MVSRAVYAKMIPQGSGGIAHVYEPVVVRVHSVAAPRRCPHAEEVVHDEAHIAQVHLAVRVGIAAADEAPPGVATPAPTRSFAAPQCSLLQARDLSLSARASTKRGRASLRLPCPCGGARARQGFPGRPAREAVGYRRPDAARSAYLVHRLRPVESSIGLAPQSVRSSPGFSVCRLCPHLRCGRQFARPRMGLAGASVFMDGVRVRISRRGHASRRDRSDAV